MTDKVPVIPEPPEDDVTDAIAGLFTQPADGGPPPYLAAKPSPHDPFRPGACGYLRYDGQPPHEPIECPNRLPCPDHGDPAGVLYRHALGQVTALLAQADQARLTAEKYGGDTTYGDTGIPVRALAAQYAATAAQYAAEATAWATLAGALATEAHTRAAVGA